ncbi:MAG: domain S-box [Pedosphaera sp.]|nr:domain S-box [Pedosphaera sp.]
MKMESILLPPLLSEAELATTNGDDLPQDFGKANILLVDDRPDKMLALEAVLSGLGQNLLKANSGKEALKLVLKHEFAVILLDVSMPVMDGFETAALIRQRPSSEHTPIIFVTSFNDSENHIAKGYSLGAVDYILSPIVPAVLKSKVSVFVELFRKTEQIKRQAEHLRRIEEAIHQRRLNEAVDRLEAETKRNRFFTLSADMLAVADFEGRMLQMNPAWEQTLGFSEEEFKAKSGLELAHPDDRAAMQGEMLKLQKGTRARYFEARYQHKDGSYRWLGWTAAPFLSERLLYIFARDITERKQAEEKIRSLNQELESRVSQLTEINGELEAFNYSISHDLRAPLRSMQGFARALLEDEGTILSTDGKEFAARIVSSGGYMDTLLHGLLSYSRLSRAELELVPVNVEGVLDEVVALFSGEIQERNAKIQLERPFRSLLGHRTTLSQIMANLIGNALKFADSSRQSVIRIHLEQGPGALGRLVVEDNGIGIDVIHQKKIFGLFERLHNNSIYPGTGIGLAIVRKGVERMGGRVGVESTPDVGSRFWIELPTASITKHE